jgi:hypothetical protein
MQDADAQSPQVQKYTSSENVIQLLYEKHDSTKSGGTDYKLYYEESCATCNQKYYDCLNYMTNAIDNGYPVCVGVNHSVKRPTSTTEYTGEWLNDGITDHFLCIYGYGKGQADGNKYYFKFYESGRNNVSDCYASDNILIFETSNNNGKIYFWCPKSHRNTAFEANKRYDVSQIRIHPDISHYLGESVACVGKQMKSGFKGDNVCIDRGSHNRYLYQKDLIK